MRNVGEKISKGGRFVLKELTKEKLRGRRGERRRTFKTRQDRRKLLVDFVGGDPYEVCEIT